MMLRHLAVGVLLVALVACERALPQPDLAALAAEARMMASHASDDFPTITSLRPLRTDVRVEEWGFFIPRAASFRSTAVGDPSFTPLGEGVWRFDIAG